MTNILKAEFKKLFRGKLVYILLIGSIVFSLLTAVLYREMYNIIGTIGGEFTYIEAFSTIFTPLNNMGLLLLIFIIVIGASDFSNRTIRTKLVGGYTRSQIYITSLLKLLIITTVVITLYAFSTYLFLTLFVGKDPTPISEYINIYIIGLTTTIILYSIINLFVFRFGTFGKTLGITFVLIIGVAIIEALLSFKLKEDAFKIVRQFLPIAGLTNLSVLTLKNFFLTLGINVFYIVGINALGLHINNKIDYV